MLKDLLLERKRSIVDAWFGAIIDTYPPDSRSFFKSVGDHFANPVGTSIKEEIQNIFLGIVSADDLEELRKPLDNVIRIRAVQGFMPSAALAFILDLKRVIRTGLDDVDVKDVPLAELTEIESRIDRVALMGFDVFMKRRELLYEIKATELRKRSQLLLDMVNARYPERARELGLDGELSCGDACKDNCDCEGR